jgi:hypothetical protein
MHLLNALPTINSDADNFNDTEIAAKTHRDLNLEI